MADERNDSGGARKRPESVLVVVHTRAGEVLLLKRRRPVFWQSVTGSLRWPDESAAAAARRELREETGIEAGDALRDWQRSWTFAILPEYRHRYGSGVSDNVEHLFSVGLDDRVAVAIDPSEHSEYRWVDGPTAAAMVWSWTNREGIELVIGDARCRL